MTKKQEENLMERTYKKIEIVGISETSFGEATQNACGEGCQSLRHVDWFEGTEMRGWLKKTKSRNSRSVTKPGKKSSLWIDRLVEVSDLFAGPLLPDSP